MARKEVKKGFRKLSLLLAFALMASLVLNVTFMDVKVQAADPIPAKYDGREYLPPIRDQKGSETCWAFATIAALEADAVKNNGFNKNTIDLSELHLAYFTYADKKDPLGLTNNDRVYFKSPSETHNYIKNGGSLDYAMATLTSGVGPVNESNAPLSSILNTDGFTVKSGAYEKALPENIRRNKNVLEIENVNMFSLKEYDRNNVKKGILEHGAAATMYYCSAKNLYNRYDNGNGDIGVAYYNSIWNDPDHGIAIVGWDDNFPKTNFNAENQPEENGAWLCRNSWGEKGDQSGWTYNGYFWLSYEDASITNDTSENRSPYAYIYDVCPAGRYDNIYQYDGGIIRDAVTTDIEQSATRYANIYTAAGNQSLKAISIQTEKGYGNTGNTLEIYKNVSNSPVDGQKIYSQKFTIGGFGFYTIVLSNSVNIDKGETFSIVITPDDSGAMSYICTDRSYSLNGSSFISVNNTNANQSYIFNGSTWEDLKYKGFYANGGTEDGTSLCIKAFTSNRKTTPTPSNPSSPTTSNPSSGGGVSGGGASGGSTSQSSNNEITISGDTSKNLSAKVEKNNVTVSNIDESVINSVINSGSHTNAKEVTLDLSKADTNISSVTITGNTINAISKVLNRKEELKDSFAIKLPNANLIFDKAALSSIATQAKTDEISVVVENTLLSQLNENQKASAEEVLKNKGKSLDMVFEAYISKGGDRISDFEGGSVSVSKLDFKIPNGKNPKFYHVYYLPKKGAPVRHVTWYENDILHFKTNHFSDYAIVYDESMENGKQTPVYRLFHSKLGDHLLTTSVAEKDAVQKIGYKLEGVGFYASGTGNKVYRLFNKNSGEHFYTTSDAEKKAREAAGWRFEGVAFTTVGEKKVYRLYNGKVHFYTTSEKEKDFCEAHGWKLEGVGFTAN